MVYEKNPLSIKLPNPWTRETDPEGNIVYYNCNTEELTTHHPLEMFFRKTFNKACLYQLIHFRLLIGIFLDFLNKNFQEIVIDELSKIPIEELQRNELQEIKRKEKKFEGHNRRVVMGSSAANNILNKFTNHFSDGLETGNKKEEEYLQRNNRSVKRYKRLLGFFQEGNWKGSYGGCLGF